MHLLAKIVLYLTQSYFGVPQQTGTFLTYEGQTSPPGLDSMMSVSSVVPLSSVPLFMSLLLSYVLLFSFVTRAHRTVNSAITCELELPIRWYPILPVHIRAPGSSPDRWVVLYSVGVKSAAWYNGSQPEFTVTEPDFQSRYKLHFSFFGKSLQKTSIWMM